MSHPQRRVPVRLAPLAALALLAACGAPGTGSGSGTGDDASSVSSPTATEYGAHVFVIETPDGGPQLCLGGVAESYPPQCGGPALVNLDWDDVADRESASGVTWGSGYAVGTYDGETFTLTRPVAPEAPDAVVPDAPEPEYGPLCADPFRGAEDAPDPATFSPADGGAQGALVTAAQALPGFVTSYVSDGAVEFNVIVSTAEGDAEVAHAALREVWGGWLCVDAQDLPTASEVAAAQEALHADGAVPGVLGSGSGADAVLNVSVEVADEHTVTAVHDAVAPWLTPAQVHVTGVLQPLP